MHVVKRISEMITCKLTTNVILTFSVVILQNFKMDFRLRFQVRYVIVDHLFTKEKHYCYHQEQ